MTHPFEVRKEIETDLSPEEIWEAIATGPGMDGWFLGIGNRVEPREGGRVEISFGPGESGLSTVTVWDPPRRFGHRGDEAPDGSLHAFEYQIEGREGGRTIVRIVHSGFLAGDWESEYDALNEGDFMYLHQMVQWAKHFRGRPVALVQAYQAEQPDRARTLAAIRRALGVTDDVKETDRVEATLDGVPPISGVVDFVSPSILGVRSDDTLYRFLHSPQNVAFCGHHIYRDDVDADASQQAWQSWLERTLA